MKIEIIGRDPLLTMQIIRMVGERRAREENPTWLDKIKKAVWNFLLTI